MMPHSNFKHYVWGAVLGASFLLSGCAGPQSCRFADRPPVTCLGDDRPVPMPATTTHSHLRRLFDVFVNRAVVSTFDAAPIPPAKDVNSMDETLTSTWFTPRLGYRTITPDDLLAGPTEHGPPQYPMRTLRTKKIGQTPGFVIVDTRGVEYLLKFDPPGYAGLETATNLIVNRLFWGFGYNVPEDHLITFTRADLDIDPGSGLTYAAIEAILDRVELIGSGYYQATASRWLDGHILGPTADLGQRPDDPNDRIPHEDLRALRALRVFGAFTNHGDLELENFLDVYEGKPDSGYVRHYLLDFGGALGSYGALTEYLWDGYQHYFSFKEMWANLLTLGLLVDSWERREFTHWPAVGAFGVDPFVPRKWQPRYPFAPIQRSQPDDDFWAVKILTALTREHITKLVNNARYPNQEAAQYMIDTLWQRREMMLQCFLRRVTPLDVVKVENNVLYLRDRWLEFSPKARSVRYSIHFYHDNDRKIVDPNLIFAHEPELVIPLDPLLLSRAEGYIRIVIRAWYDDKVTPRPVQFHLRTNEENSYHIVGVVH